MVVLAVAATLAVAGRWFLARTDALGRPRGFPVISVASLLVVAVGAAFPVVREHRLEARLSAVGSTVAGRAVVVDCQTRGQEMVDAGSELGWVRYDEAGRPEQRTLIKRAPCARLRHYLSAHGRDPSLDEVVSVHVLGHEVQHMVGRTVESEAECASVQRDAAVARLLGASPADAIALGRRYWREVFPRLREDYVSGECRPGGRLDERLPDAPWTGS